MKKFFLLTCLILAMVTLKAQDEITVKFTSTTQIGSYCPFNAVNVSNLSRNWEKVLVYPDTTLLLQSSVGISERIELSPIEVHPNPFSNWTNASFSLETASNVKVQLFQLTGKEIASYSSFFEAGAIQIRIMMSQPELALLVITTSNSRQVAKVLNVGNGNSNSIEVSHYASKNEHIGRIANLLGDFMPGDTMRYEAVAYDNGNMLTSEVITKAQYENETIVLSFNVTQPEVSTFEVSNITQTSALGGGEVTLSGGLPVIERGICWSTQNNPSINGNHSSNGNGIGAYTVNMYNLNQNTTYYVRAYAINGVGISYGQEVQFTTSLNVSAPTVMTSQVTSVTQTSAIGGGNVTDDGGASVTERGICWGTGHNPTINNNHSSNGSGLGGYTVNMTGLSEGTTYYVKAYAINSQGISYGQEVSFTTTAFPPTVTTSQVTDITQTSALGGGNVTDDGGGTVTERGICWSTSHNPTISSSHSNSGSGTGSFSVNMSGLSANTTYYVRAYAINNAGTAYGSEVGFTTLLNVSLPTVTTSQVTNITQTTATGGGIVTSDGGGTVTERGICWGTSHNPTTSGNHASNGTGTGSYTVNMTGLTANTTYYVRAYATNSAGTAYGSEVSFTTSQANPTYTITVSANPSMAGSVSGGGSYQQGQSCTVTATATSGYTFVRWTENGTQVSTNASYTFTVTSNRTLVANFNLNGGGSHEYVNLGLPSGTLWATCNVGASSPEDYGAYFAWGETQLKDVYNWSTYVYCHGTGTTLTKYCNNSSYGYNGFTDNLTTLLSVDDAATANWGADWRMPTSEEWSELQDNTNAAWTMQNGVYGWLFTATNGNSLFLPAAGGYGDNGPVNPGTDGGYWSSSLCTSDPSHAWYYYFWSGFGEVWDWSRDFGRSVRAVFNSAPSVTLPTVTTSQVTNITQTTATGGGNVTNDGGGTVTERGICWSTSHNPTTSGNHANSGTGTGSYSINMTGLTANTTYYVRAYATNSAGTAYGSEVSFTTLQNASLPTVTTSQVTNITQTTATGGGNVTATGGSNVTERGICWSTSHNPTTSGNHANSGIGTGIFTINMTGLTANTTYYVRAYAMNSAGTAYGSEVSFTTLQNASLPTVTTSQVTNITQTSATGGGTVTSSGGGTVTERGICWSTSHNPTTNGSHASNGTGTGSFSVNMTSLSANTIYYVRAYAINSMGTAYGGEVSFTTSQMTTYTIIVSADPSTGGSVNGGGSYQQGQSCTVSATAALGYAFINWREDGNVVSSNASYTFIVTANRTLVANFTAVSSWPNGVLPGVFSVSETQQVHFSQGNLQYKASTNTWRFADNQWQCIGNAQTGSSQTIDRDLFGWGTSGYNHGAVCYQPWSTSTYYSDYYAYGNWIYNLYNLSGQADWGYNPISNGGNIANQWRTLTWTEWHYVFNTRSTASGIRFAKANVCDVNGMLLLPDDWDSSIYYLNNTNSAEASFDSNTISSSQWITLENAGAVFLPAAGLRLGTSVSTVGTGGSYWSASYYSREYAYNMYFYGPFLYTNDYTTRDEGQSVRLVKDDY